jgi:acyl-CoA synthetase (NDP forming)
MVASPSVITIETIADRTKLNELEVPPDEAAVAVIRHDGGEVMLALSALENIVGGLRRAANAVRNLNKETHHGTPVA